jgi:hypothetical protein
MKGNPDGKMVKIASMVDCMMSEYLRCQYHQSLDHTIIIKGGKKE